MWKRGDGDGGGKTCLSYMNNFNVVTFKKLQSSFYLFQDHGRRFDFKLISIASWMISNQGKDES